MDNFTVCYFGTYREEYSRNKIMLKSLEKQGINVIICHEKIWENNDERVEAVKTGLFNPKLWKKIIFAYSELIKKFFTIPDFDLLIIGYPGQMDVFLARILAWIKQKPLVWDVFMSIYLISIERGLDKKNKLFVHLLKIIEKIALRLPNLLIFDTKEYAGWFKTTYKIKKMHYCLVPTGADEEIYSLCENQSNRNTDQFKLVYYGTFIPNHGVSYIIEASKFLTLERNINFQFIGEGPELEKCKNLVAKYNLSNIEFIPWQNPNQIKNFIEDADIVLGAFGKTPQSLMTVQNKIYESLSMGKLVVSGDSPTIRTHLDSDLEIILCDRDDPANLAEKIVELRMNENLRTKVAENGHIRFINNYSIEKLGEAFVCGLKEFLVK